MQNFFTFLDTNRFGIFVLFLCLAAVVLLVQWLAWIFSWGRFKTTRAKRGPEGVQYVLSQFLVNIIDDFRHLLALIIVIIFAIVLAYAMIQAGNRSDEMTRALQAVVSTLGAIIGSILGYYFGESAATKSLAREQPPIPTSEPVLPPREGEEEIVEAPPPPPAVQRDHG
jgi:hypothetical protein